jgi:hypothetical protein
MFFCGQCGFQVAPGMTRCPRCGAAVDTTNAGPAGDLHSDDPTVASPSLPSSQTGMHTRGDQQRLVLHPESGDDYGAPTVFGSATHMDTPAYPTYGTPPGGQNYPTTGGQQGTYGGYTPGGQPYQQNYPDQAQYDQAARNRGRTTGLVLILIGLLMILSAVALFVLQQHGGGTGSTDVTTPQALIQALF